MPKATMGCRWMVLVFIPFLSLLLFVSLFVDYQLTKPIIPWLEDHDSGAAASIAPTAPASTSTTLAGTTTSSSGFSILIGILTLPDKYERRNFLRLVYAAQKPDPSVATIDLKFVFCALSKPEQHLFVSLEISHYNDIIILNCTENMNQGKTYTYFSSLPHLFPRPYDYVMKADDDVYIRLDNLMSSLYQLPRNDLYYGYSIPCGRKDPYERGAYMSGMGFVLSWDLVEWISTSDIPPKNKEGPEDKMVGKWLSDGKKATNRVTEKPGMYDFPGTNGAVCSHPLIPETVAVHKVKKWEQWRDVLDYFNATVGIVKPSKLIHGVNARFLSEEG